MTIPERLDEGVNQGHLFAARGSTRAVSVQLLNCVTCLRFARRNSDIRALLDRHCNHQVTLPQLCEKQELHGTESSFRVS